MDCLFEALFQIFAELFLGAIVEVVADLIGRGIAWGFRAIVGADVMRGVAETPIRGGMVVLWVLAGVGFGALSLLVFPHPLIRGRGLQVANLVVSPFLMAGGLVVWGRVLAKYDRRRTPLNHFACALGFAVGYLMMRFWFTY